jgi:hypothetical protein
MLAQRQRLSINVPKRDDRREADPQDAPLLPAHRENPDRPVRLRADLRVFTSALVFLGKRWIGLDILPSPGLFERAWPRLCAGYAAEAVGGKERASAPDPRGVLQTVAQAPVEEAPAVGLGRERRLTGRALAGVALVVDDTVAHLLAFPAEA